MVVYGYRYRFEAVRTSTGRRELERKSRLERMKHPFFVEANRLSKHLKVLETDLTKRFEKVKELSEINVKRLDLAKVYLQKSIDELEKIEIG
jgi:hypothetical protein